MKKIKLSHDVKVRGYGIIPKGTEFKVKRFNSRYVYVDVRDGVELQLSRKNDTETIY